MNWHLVHEQHGIVRSCEAPDIDTARERLGWHSEGRHYVQSAASYAIPEIHSFIPTGTIARGRQALYADMLTEAPPGYLDVWEIAEEIGMSEQSVRDYAKRVGCEPTAVRAPGNNARAHFYSPAQVNRIKQWWARREAK